jgi:GH15 family glucan-1,4-alpha-glucosidase
MLWKRHPEQRQAKTGVSRRDVAMDRYPDIGDYGLTGEQLGNFPQAFSHLARINVALDLEF